MFAANAPFVVRVHSLGRNGREAPAKELSPAVSGGHHAAVAAIWFENWRDSRGFGCYHRAG
jgi:hypothetical protein